MDTRSAARQSVSACRLNQADAWGLGSAVVVFTCTLVIMMLRVYDLCLPLAACGLSVLQVTY